MNLRYSIRKLLRQKLNTILSVLCLIIGFFVVILVEQWLDYEFNFDRFHKDSEKIYRLTLENHNRETGYYNHFARIAAFRDWLPGLEENVAGIESLTRFSHWPGGIVGNDEKSFTTNMYFTDSSFLRVFSLDFLSGSAENAFSEPNTMIISESAARRIFGREDPLGQALDVYCKRCPEKMKFSISAVVRDYPPDSHFHFDFLARYPEEQYFSWSYYYLKLDAPPDPESVTDRIYEYAGINIDSANLKNYSFHLQAMTDIHLHSDKDREIEPNGSMKGIYLFILLGAIILFISLFNFVNLRYVNLAKFSRSQMILKAFGGGFFNLFINQLVEVLFLTVFSILAAFFLVHVFIHITGQGIFGKELPFSVPEAMLTSFVLVILSTIAGLFPFLESEIRAGWKGRIPGRSAWNWQLYGTGRVKMSLSRILVGLQYSFTLILMILLFVITGQIDILLKGSVGGKNSNVLVIDELPVQTGPGYEIFKNEILKNPLIWKVTSSFENPGDENMDMFHFESPGTDPGTSEKLLSVYPADDNYFRFYNIPFLAGNDFSDYTGNDSVREDYILNRTALEYLGWTPEEAVGREFRLQFDFLGENLFNGGRIAGIVEDFQPSNMKNTIKPYVFFQKSFWLFSAQISYDTTRTQEVIDGINKVWVELYPGIPMEYSFLSDIYSRLYAGEIRMKNLSLITGILAFVLSLTGLIGVTLVIFRSRIKEIAIRKVFGAGTGQISVLLVKELLVILLPAILIAVPVAWKISLLWLTNYAYPYHPGLFLYLFLALIICLVAISTVFLLSVRSSRLNPATALAYE